MGNKNQIVAASVNTFPSTDTLPLVADVQYREPFTSGALNRKLKGILQPGIYSGFTPTLPGGMVLRIESEQTEGSASVDIGPYQISIRQQSAIDLTLAAGTTNLVVLEANYALGQETYQVNSSSSVQAAQIKIADNNGLMHNQIELCKVTVPAGVTELNGSMVDITGRINKAIGISLSSSFDSSNENIAANSNAVKLGLESIIGSAPIDMNTLEKITKALGNDPEFITNITKELADKLSKSENGNDIPNKDLFRKNIGLGEAAKLDAPTLFTNDNGYVSFPLSGQSLIIQWRAVPILQNTGGNMASVIAVWPIAFPTACLTILQALTYSMDYSGSSFPHSSARILNNSQFQVASGYRASKSTVIVWGIGY